MLGARPPVSQLPAVRRVATTIQNTLQHTQGLTYHVHARFQNLACNIKGAHHLDAAGSAWTFSWKNTFTCLYRVPADVHMLLGDLSSENDAFAEALEDYRLALELLSSHLPEVRQPHSFKLHSACVPGASLTCRRPRSPLLQTRVQRRLRCPHACNARLLHALGLTVSMFRHRASSRRCAGWRSCTTRPAWRCSSCTRRHLRRSTPRCVNKHSTSTNDIHEQEPASWRCSDCTRRRLHRSTPWWGPR